MQQSDHAVKPMPQSNPCHSQTHATVKPMPQSNPCHSQTHSTVKPLIFADNMLGPCLSKLGREGRIGWYQGWQGLYKPHRSFWSRDCEAVLLLYCRKR